MKCRLSETTFPRVSASAIWLASALRLSTSVPKSVRSAIIDAFLKCGILAHGFLRLRCGDCGHDKLVGFSCKRRGFCP